MKKLVLVLGCAALFVFPPATVNSQKQDGANHGGKIETKYDGFAYETTMRLRKMKVSCDGIKDKFQKNECVSIEVTLHCPGTQLNYVRNVTMQIVFENKDWIRFHAPDQRDLSVLIDTETLKLGKMNPVAKEPGSWDTKVEILEATIPYEAFKKMASSQSVAIQVGRSSVDLREKNLAALKDLNSRVITPEKTSTSTSQK